MEEQAPEFRLPPVEPGAEESFEDPPEGKRAAEDGDILQRIWVYHGVDWYEYGISGGPKSERRREDRVSLVVQLHAAVQAQRAIAAAEAVTSTFCPRSPLPTRAAGRRRAPVNAEGGQETTEACMTEAASRRRGPRLLAAL